MTEKFSLEEQVDPAFSGQRLDQVAARVFPDFSRARLQQWIKSGNLLVDNKAAKTRDKLLGGELLSLSAEVEPLDHWAAEAIPLAIVHEDESLMVIDKPAGLVVHPAAGNRGGTLLNGLLHHCEALNRIPRCGIVHRLDKDTSGLLVVAKTLKSHACLVEQLRTKRVNRVYQCVVQGVVTAGGTVDAPLGRHPVNRKKRAVVTGADAREAVTHYRILHKFRAHTHLQVMLETGRTHQIRVHMAHIGHPLTGDPAYGGRTRIPKGASPALIDFLAGFKRQALHAWQLGLVHPASGEQVSWRADLPSDMQTLLQLLEQDHD